MGNRLAVDAIARFLVFIAVVLTFVASQLFWLRRVRELGEKLIPSRPWREWLGAAAVILYLYLFSYNLVWAHLRPSPTRMTFGAALLEAPFTWWLISSLAGFALVILFWCAGGLARLVHWTYVNTVGAQHAAHRQDPPSPDRRRFLERTAVALSAAPFVAGGYGLLYGRLNLEITRRRIRLARLPKAFDGFRIAQLSDIHIGPFMSAEEIRKYVAITSGLKSDLVVLTGDFVTWDATTQAAAVEALAGLKAPFGIYGCLGNHELWTDTEESITSLFAAQGVRILRQERAAIQSKGEALNLIGVDFQTRRGMAPYSAGLVRNYLRGIDPLVARDTVSILLTHNPNAFDRAAELGIDLSLAGHTHGGQVSLEFVHPGLSPSRLITPYVSGWYEKRGAQLYVNRGIGTIGVPVRVGAPPEITVFELIRS